MDVDRSRAAPGPTGRRADDEHGASTEEHRGSAGRAGAADWGWQMVVPAAAAIVLGLGTLQLMWAAGRAIAVVVLAIALAAALAPIVARVARHIPRGGAVVLVYVAAAAMLVTGGWLAAPAVQQQTQQIADQAPQLLTTIQERIGSYLPQTVQPEQVLTRLSEQFLGVLQQVPQALASFVFEVLVIIFLSLYLLTVSPRIHSFLVSLFPSKQRRRASAILCRMADSMGGYFRGTAIDGAIIGLLTALALWVIGVDFIVPLAVLAAAGEFVPYIGPVVAAIPAIGAGLLQSTEQGIIVALTYLGIQQIESHIVTPNIMRTQTDIRPAAVIVALTAGYAVGGILGAVAAIPIFAAGRVLLLRAVAPAIRAASRRRKG